MLDSKGVQNQKLPVTQLLPSQNDQLSISCMYESGSNYLPTCDIEVFETFELVPAIIAMIIQQFLCNSRCHHVARSMAIHWVGWGRPSG